MEAASCTSDNQSTGQHHSDASSSDSLADEGLQANPATTGAGLDEYRTSATAEYVASSTNHAAMEQSELYLEYFHSSIIREDLATIKNPRLSLDKMANAIRELIRVKGYRSSDHGKEFKFRWTDNSTYYLVKYCNEIGPFYGFERLKSPRVEKLERSSFISLKWSCILYDLLLSLQFENNIIPTEGQIKQRCRYLTDMAHPKLFAVTTGDERNPFSITGVDKIDDVLEQLCRLKNDSELSKAEYHKRVTDQRHNKRSVGQMLCSNSIPSVIESLVPLDSDEQSSIDDVNQPNTITVEKRNRSGKSLNSRDVASFAHYFSELSAPTRELQDSALRTIEATLSEERKREAKAQQQIIEFQQQQMEYSAQKEKREQFDHEAKKIKTVMEMTLMAQSLEKGNSSSTNAVKKMLQDFLAHYA
ncbi:LAFA_0G01618g1_1 [Lachancea sp. 'fantastica']|nr:LAFA_0G01618g1_1 [Lachancea sp. 'fantastica']